MVQGLPDFINQDFVTVTVYMGETTYGGKKFMLAYGFGFHHLRSGRPHCLVHLVKLEDGNDRECLENGKHGDPERREGG